MNIRAKLRLTMAISIGTAVIVGAVIFLSLQKLNTVRGETARIQTLQKEEAELRSTTFEYLTYHEQRMYLQWLSKHAKITKLLDGLREEHKEPAALIEEIRRNHKTVGALFDMMTGSMRETPGNGTLSSGKTRPEPSSRERETILGGQLLLRTQYIILGLLRLSAHTGSAMADAQEKMALAVVLSVLLLVAVITAAFLTIMKSLVKPLARLTAGAERIGAGDLTQRIEVKSEDEIGRLGDAFNHMAAELERRVAGLSALNVVGTVINETVELEQLLTRTLEEGLRLVGVEAGAVLLLDEGAGGLALVAHRGLSDELVQAAQWLKLGEGLAGRAAQIGQPVVMGETAEYHGALKALVERDRIQSVASVPLLGRTGVIGVMNLVTRNPHYFDAAGLELLTSLGRQIAVGIEKARLFEAVQRELTERRRAEETLEHTLADLARSNKELERFAYIASHDLQEPLRMVSSYTQLLARRYRGKLDADADEFIAYAVDGADRMQRMINDLLAYSRLGTKGKPFEPVDCHSVLGQALSNLSAAIQESNALVTNDALPTVMADDLQLVLLFQNLIGNAIKFHGQGPPRVHVSARQEGTEWVFSVRDNGIGIDLQYHERIFVLFQRLHGRNDYPGTGIGLAICKGIVERHGGRIRLESEAGNGSTFYFTIPMRRGE